MTEPRLFEQSAGGDDIVFGNKQAPRQNADRAFQHAHILIQHDMGDIGCIQQSLESGNQYGVVGANKLAHNLAPGLPIHSVSISNPRESTGSLLIETGDQNGNALGVILTQWVGLNLPGLGMGTQAMPRDYFGSAHRFPLTAPHARVLFILGALARLA
jgi:hypothetical protein